MAFLFHAIVKQYFIVISVCAWLSVLSHTHLCYVSGPEWNYAALLVHTLIREGAHIVTPVRLAMNALMLMVQEKQNALKASIALEVLPPVQNVHQDISVLSLIRQLSFGVHLGPSLLKLQLSVQSAERVMSVQHLMEVKCSVPVGITHLVTNHTVSDVQLVMPVQIEMQSRKCGSPVL